MPEDRDLARMLDESEALRQGMLAAAPAGVAHILANGTFRFANAEALRILGITEEALPTRKIADWAPITVREDGSPYPVEEYATTIALQTGQPSGPKTVGIRQPDGKVLWCIFRAAPIKDRETGETAGAVLGFLDVTEQVTVTKTLRDQQSKLDAILANAPNVIFTLTPEGRFTSMHGTVSGIEANVDANSILGQRLFDWINPRDHDMVRGKIRRVVEHGETVHYDVLGREGVDPNTYLTNLGPVWRDGKVVDIVGIVL